MATPVLRLRSGGRVLDLNDRGRYFLQTDFVPPAARETPLLAEGSSSNRFGGSVKMGSSFADRMLAFTVGLKGTTQMEITRAANDMADFLSLAGDPSQPVYLEWHPNPAIAALPVWGQGGWLRYEVTSGSVNLAAGYLSGGRFAYSTDAALAILVKPLAVGLQQQLMTATGRVYEDDWGQPGQSRGLVVSEAITNKMTNPVFGHATWDNGWTTAAALISRQNTDPAFVMFGGSSAYLTAFAAGSTRFYQNIAVGNTNNHFAAIYVKRLDSGPVTTADVVIQYNDITQTTVFTPIGDGFYRGVASFTGISAATHIGVLVLPNRDINLAGMMFHESASLCLPMVYGDQLGCSWSGTAHASTSTCLGGKLRLPTAALSASGRSLFNPAQGSVRIVVTPYVSSASVAAQNRWLFRGSTSAFSLRRATTNFWIFTAADGTAVTSASATFAAGDTLVFHATWAGGALNLYLNGAMVATGATYVPTAFDTYVNLGCNTTAIEHFPGTIGGLTLWDTAISAAEALADYTNIAPLAAADERVGAIPYLWTKDGDDVVDNTTDTVLSTGFPHNNFAVCAGIPGSAPAVTRFRLLSSYIASTYGLFLSNFTCPFFIDPALYLAFVQGGTAGAVTDSNQAYRQTSLNTQALLGQAEINVPNAHILKAMGGREFYLFARLYDAGSTLQLQLQFFFSGGTWAPKNALKSVTGTTTPKWLFTDPLAFPTADQFLSDASYTPQILTVWMLGNRTTPAAANVRIDELVLMPRPLLKINGDSAMPGLILEGAKAVHLSNTNVLGGLPVVQGDSIELVPGQYNTLLTILGEVINTAVINDTLTYTGVWVTPRYVLI